MDEQKLKTWIQKVITAELGDTSRLPASVQSHIFATYETFARVYLAWLRIDLEKPPNWIPNAAEFKTSLVDGMAHFLSDHQYLVSEMNLLKSRVRRLLTLECRRDSKAYRECVEHILSGVENRAVFNRIYLKLKEENS